MKIRILFGTVVVAAAGLVMISQKSGAQEGGANRQPPPGITVEGEVKNFTPVTDAMLRNPDPADWLMIRQIGRAHV